MKTLKTEQFKSPRDLTAYVNNKGLEVVAITNRQIEQRESNAETKILTFYRLFYFETEPRVFLKD